jgi:hypothetical protein
MKEKDGEKRSLVSYFWGILYIHTPMTTELVDLEIKHWCYQLTLSHYILSQLRNNHNAFTCLHQTNKSIKSSDTNIVISRFLSNTSGLFHFSFLPSSFVLHFYSIRILASIYYCSADFQSLPAYWTSSLVS